MVVCLVDLASVLVFGGFWFSWIVVSWVFWLLLCLVLDWFWVAVVVGGFSAC